MDIFQPLRVDWFLNNYWKKNLPPPPPDARGGGLLCSGPPYAGVPDAGDVQALHGRAGAVHVPAGDAGAGARARSVGSRIKIVVLGDTAPNIWKKNKLLGRDRPSFKINYVSQTGHVDKETRNVR